MKVEMIIFLNDNVIFNLGFVKCKNGEMYNYKISFLNYQKLPIQSQI